MPGRSAGAPTAARRVAAVVLTLSWGLACKQILDVPQEPGDVIEAGKKYCTCPGLEEQGQELLDRCKAAFGSDEQPDYDHALAVARAGCTDCPYTQDDAAQVPDSKELGRCYGEITGARPTAEACATYTDCTTFACCTTEVQYGVSSEGKGLLSKNVCCGSCASCAATDGVDLVPGVTLELCAESIPVFNAYATCVCGQRDPLGDACDAKVGGPCGTGPLFCGSAACRECLLAEYPNACKAQVDACLGDAGRPVVGQ